MALFYGSQETLLLLDDRKPGGKYFLTISLLLSFHLILCCAKKVSSRKLQSVPYRNTETLVDNFLNIYSYTLVFLFLLFGALVIAYWYFIIIYKNSSHDKHSSIPLFFIFQIFSNSFIQWIPYMQSQPLR